ncbi:MAG: ATP-binding protein [Bernardetiaceae bacterium]|jgi:AAA15 family ATPase/GTPase|nr:ATP-binding protein [Bernardetiaceae bacterium]
MQKIVVENFRQIPFAEIEIRQLLFLIGEQATGKSTLAKLIYFFKSLKDDFTTLISDQSKDIANLQTAFIREIQEKFRVYFGSTAELTDNFQITFFYYYDAANTIAHKYLRLTKTTSLQITFSDNYLREVVNSTRLLAERVRQQVSQSQLASGTDYMRAEREKTRLFNELVNQVNALFYDNYQPMFFPAGRNITVSFPEQFQAQFLSALPIDKGLPKSVDLVLMRSFILHSKFLIDVFKQYGLEQPDEVSRFIADHTRYVLKGTYDNSDGTEKIKIDDRESVPLNLASSGQQEVVRIIQDLLYIWISRHELAENHSAFRVMEEPEAHLHPSAQKRLLELIALVANLTGSQFLLTTHSPYLISVLNNLMMYSVVQENDPVASEALSNHFGTGQLLNEEGDARINLLREQVQAYALGQGVGPFCVSLIDPETGLIGDNYLDGVTEELNSDFNFLYHLHFAH